MPIFNMRYHHEDYPNRVVEIPIIADDEDWARTILLDKAKFNGCVIDSLSVSESRELPDPDDVLDVPVEVLATRNLSDLSQDERDRIAEDLEFEIRPFHERAEFQNCKTRRDYAMHAARISEDRYSAGSASARATIVILLRHGVQAAIDFMKDVDHHEGN